MNLLSCLLPDPLALRLDSCDVDEGQGILALTLTSQQTTPRCPLCRVPAQRVHSHYERTLADLPWGSWSVRLWLGVRKLFCDNAQCARRIFTERLPGVVAPWARKTKRLIHLLQTLAETLETVFTTHSAELRALEPVDRAPAPNEAVPPAPPPRPATARVKATERRKRRLAQDQHVWKWHREGWPAHVMGCLPDLCGFLR